MGDRETREQNEEHRKEMSDKSRMWDFLQSDDLANTMKMKRGWERGWDRLRDIRDTEKQNKHVIYTGILI